MWGGNRVMERSTNRRKKTNGQAQTLRLKTALSFLILRYFSSVGFLTTWGNEKMHKEQCQVTHGHFVGACCIAVLIHGHLHYR